MDLSLIGDGECKNGEPYNQPECGYDGGDYFVPQVEVEVPGMPGCFVVDPELIGDEIVAETHIPILPAANTKVEIVSQSKDYRMLCA